MEYDVRQLFRQTPADQSQVTVSGWVRTLRDSKAFAFIELNDGTFFKNVQIVCEEENLANFKEVTKITLGSAITVTGILALTPEMKQPFEIKASQVEIVGLSDPDYPLQKKRHTFEYLRTQAHLRPRTNTFSAVFRIRSLAAQAIHAFFASRNFVYVHTPIITTSDAEGAGEMFRATTLDLNNLPRDEHGKVLDKEDFFGRPANLSVSGQLNVECYAQAFRNVYTFGPTFRAEKSYTPRHAAEFWMIEPEIAFADLEDDMVLAEDMLKYVIADVMAKAPEEMAFLNQFVDKGLIERLNHVVSSKLDRARALSGRRALRLSRVRVQLSQGNQGLLHAPERRRQDRRRRGRAGARHRRTDRRQPARREAGRAGSPDQGAGPGHEFLLVVPGTAEIRHHAPCRLRPGL